MSMKKRVERYLFTIASAILLIGIAGNLWFYFTSCENRIKGYVKSEIKKEKSGKRFFVLYVINSVNIGCGGIPYFEKLRDRKDAYIKIYVKYDFTDSDINNLRETFSVPKSIKIVKINKQFKKIYNSCIYDYESGNFMINYDRKINKLIVRGGF